MQYIFALILLLCQLVNPCLAFDIKGRLDLKLRNVSNHDIMRTQFKIYRINDDSNDIYSLSTRLESSAGEFTFRDVPIDTGLNQTTYFALHSSSLEFNLKPNRILIEVIGSGADAGPTVKAYENKFGREYFPSPDILFPETLKPVELDAEGRITITVMNKQPLRRYIIVRNPGILSSGPIASILNSRLKLAGVITVIMMFVFPFLLEKLDPETAKAVRQQKFEEANAKYLTKDKK